MTERPARIQTGHLLLSGRTLFRLSLKLTFQGEWSSNPNKSNGTFTVANTSPPTASHFMYGLADSSPLLGTHHGLPSHSKMPLSKRFPVRIPAGRFLSRSYHKTMMTFTCTLKRPLRSSAKTGIKAGPPPLRLF